jgi:hypothetical protein
MTVPSLGTVSHALLKQHNKSLIPVLLSLAVESSGHAENNVVM